VEFRRRAGPKQQRGTLQRRSTMTVALILHRVADYDAWRKVYDSVGDMQKDSGVTEESVHQMIDDPNNVLVIHHFDNVETAKAFFVRDDLRDAMQRSGVQGEPRVELFE
jgi:hypothetical protein